MRVNALAMVIALVVADQCLVRADRDIVFSAQFYRWSSHYYKDSYGGPPERTLDDIGMSHIYRINPDGSGLTRVTSSQFDDFDPKWSPDGQEILFWRGRMWSEGTTRLMVMRQDGRNIRTLATFRGREVANFRYDWSPDGRKIAFHYKEESFSTPPSHHMFILDSRSGRKLRVLNATEFSWSPDGSSIYLSGRSRDSILDLATGKTRQLRHRIIRPVWITRHHIVGLNSDDADWAGFENPRLRQFDLHDLSVSDIAFPNESKNELIYGGGAYGRDWYFLYSEALLALQVNHGVSDGIHSDTYIVNCNSGFWKHVIDGPTVAVSPDGWRLLVTTHKWVGPYKRGGRRCGSLEIVDAVTLKRHKITTNLVTISGGDWRGNRRRTPKSLSFR